MPLTGSLLFKTIKIISVITISMVLFSLNSSSAFNVYAQQGGAANSGPATGGAASGPGATGGAATSGPATGGAAIGGGGNSTSNSSSVSHKSPF
jgi:hypothetical protein